jgi:hypothetical protein
MITTDIFLKTTVRTFSTVPQYMKTILVSSTIVAFLSRMLKTILRATSVRTQVTIIVLTKTITEAVDVKATSDA